MQRKIPAGLPGDRFSLIIRNERAGEVKDIVELFSSFRETVRNRSSLTAVTTALIVNDINGKL